MAAATQHHQPVATGKLVFGEVLVVVLFAVAGFLLNHHLDFVAPPAPALPLSAPGAGHEPPEGIHWRGMALLEVVLIIAIVLRLAHRSEWFHENMFTIMLVSGIVGVAFAFWYFYQWTHGTCDVDGHRFTVGWSYKSPDLQERYGDSCKRAIEENPDSLDTVWAETSITANSLWLGANYLICLFPLVFSLLLAADVLAELFLPRKSQVANPNDPNVSAAAPCPELRHGGPPDG